MKAALDLVPPGRGPRLWLFGLCVLLPAAILGAALAWPSTTEGALGLSSLATLAGAALLTLGLWWLLDRAMRRHHLDVGDGRIRVRTSFYSKTVALDELQLEAARVVDLQERTELKPALKTNGYALPGFRSGHFRLRNGSSAFVAITGNGRVLWLPTTRRQALLLQPAQPEALLAHLRELAKANPRR